MSGSEEEASGDLYYLTVVYGRSTHRAHSACAGRRVARYPPPCRPPPTPAPLTSPAAAASPALSPSPARGDERAGRARRTRGGSLRGVRATAPPDHSSGPNHLGREHAGSALGQLALPRGSPARLFRRRLCGGVSQRQITTRSRPDHDQVTTRSRPHRRARLRPASAKHALARR